MFSFFSDIYRNDFFEEGAFSGESCIFYLQSSFSMRTIYHLRRMVNQKCIYGANFIWQLKIIEYALIMKKNKRMNDTKNLDKKSARRGEKYLSMHFGKHSLMSNCTELCSCFWNFCIFHANSDISAT